MRVGSGLSGWRWVAAGLVVAVAAVSAGVATVSVAAPRVARSVRFTPPEVFASYADGVRTVRSHPSPWRGSPNVVFKGCNYFTPSRCPRRGGRSVYDAGALRLDNGTSRAMVVTDASVMVGSCTFRPWPGLRVSVPRHKELILTQTGAKPPCPGGAVEGENFDTSDTILTGDKCHNGEAIPVFDVTVDGHALAYRDTRQVLNTGSLDPGARVCGAHDETHGWAPMSPTAGSAVPPVRWHRCATSWGMPPHWLCALYPVPLDYAHPGAGSVSLAVAKLPAADPEKRRGSVFFNPGGPGAAGLPHATGWEHYVGPSVHRVFDLVTWDPRGVIRSKPPLFCLSPEATTRAEDTPMAVLTDREMKTRLKATAAIARGCASKRLTRFVTTMDNVRDLDRLRQAVGDKKLSYVGISYGTAIGAVYANVFPNRYRALVLHGVVDSTTWFQSSFAFTTDQGVQLQKTLDAALRACDSVPATCALAPNARHKYARLLARVRALVTGSGKSEEFTGLVYLSHALLASRSATTAARELERCYQRIVVNHATSCRELIEEAHKPPPRILFGDATAANESNVYAATRCSDFGRIPGSWIAAAHRADRVAPVFGALTVLIPSACASWSAFGDRYTGGWDHGRDPILVLNQQWDPATPLAWAQTMTRRLGQAHLVTISGWGHGNATPCSTSAVDGYLLTGRLPTTSFCNDGRGLFTARLQLRLARLAAR